MLITVDLLGVPDETVWRYEAGLRHIVASCELKYLHFVQFNELLQFEPSTWTKEHVLAHVDNYRRELVNKYTSSSAESDEHYVSQKYPLPDYVIRGLSHVNEEERGELLKLAQGRSLAYHVAVSTAKPDSLSLEAALYSAVTAPVDSVLIITLFPQGNSDAHFVSWDSVIAIERNGRYRSTTLSEVQDDTTYELIVDESGTPSHYRAKDSMWDWTADGLEVTFEHLYPTGTIIRPSASYAGKPPSITTLPMRKIRSLAQRFSPIVLRGFDETTNEDHFLMKGNELGEVLTWTFGQILKVKDSGEVDKNANNVTSNEAMPMHFDGIFKFIDRVDPISGEVKNVLTPPRYQYFTCLSTAPKGDGYTLFANSCLFFEALPAPFSLGRLEKVTWSMVNDGFWSAKQTELPLVVRHEETGAACLRWHEPWTQTKFSKYYFEIENDDAAEKLKAVINKLLYDYRICLRFEWEQGDLLINDNVSMLHTRTAFAGSCEREMWRIHFD
jgi:alpha-ketoglutarate-dependent taurine dioxygenase